MVSVFVLSVSTGPSVTSGTELSRITASTAVVSLQYYNCLLLLEENTLHTEGLGEGITNGETEGKNAFHFCTISTKPLAKEMTILPPIVLVG